MGSEELLVLLRCPVFSEGREVDAPESVEVVLAVAVLHGLLHRETLNHHGPAPPAGRRQAAPAPPVIEAASETTLAQRIIRRQREDLGAVGVLGNLDLGVVLAQEVGTPF